MIQRGGHQQKPAETREQRAFGLFRWAGTHTRQEDTDMSQGMQWDGFEGHLWKEEVNVREFIQKNYQPYDGDSSFLEGPTEATEYLWGRLHCFFRKTML